MLKLLLAAVLVVVVAAAPQSLKWYPLQGAEQMEQKPAFVTNVKVDAQWNDFKDKHNKNYETADEELKRMAIFYGHLEKIKAHNALHAQGKKSYTLGINKYADLEHHEFVAMMNGLKMRAGDALSSGATYMSPLAPVTLPKEVDWRTKGYVTAVKDQGGCGSCWAFSTTGSLEGQHFRKSGKLVSLSEQNLVDCSKKWGNHGCHGGLMDNAFQYIEDNDGLDTENGYPYIGKDRPCHFKSSRIGATDKGFTDVVPHGEEKTLQEALATVGPISIAIDASQSTFQLYKNGVYDEPDCSSVSLDHGVLLVGYGTDEKSGSDYWLVKNSWGESWGLGGYIRMSRNKKNQCGVATMASYPNV